MKFGFTSGLGGSAIDAHSGVKRPAWERPEARPTRFHWGWGSGCGPGLEPLPGSAEARQPAPRPRSHTGPPPRGAAGAARGRSSNFARSARRRLSRARTPNFARPSAARPAPQPARRAAPQPRSSSPRAGPVFTSGRGPGVAPAAAPAQEARSPVSQSAAKFRTMDSSEPAGSAGPVGSTQPRSRGPGHRCLRHRRSPPPPCRAASPPLPPSVVPPSLRGAQPRRHRSARGGDDAGGPAARWLLAGAAVLDRTSRGRLEPRRRRTDVVGGARREARERELRQRRVAEASGKPSSRPAPAAARSSARLRNPLAFSAALRGGLPGWVRGDNKDVSENSRSRLQ